jgi:hypothetical protein
MRQLSIDRMSIPFALRTRPTTAPADWGPMSINLEDVPYPHPVNYFAFTVEGQDVRMPDIFDIGKRYQAIGNRYREIFPGAR